MSKVRWAVIGASGFSQRRTIPEGIVPSGNGELVAVMSRQEERIRPVAQRFGVPWFSDVEAMLDTVPIDAVYIASPPAGHLEQTRLCAERGKHVLCEKPLAHTVADAEAMVAVCREKGVLLGTAFMLPFHSLAEKTIEIVQRGDLGVIVSARIQFGFDYSPSPGAFRQVAEEGGGGAFMDVGNHAMDLMERMIGSRIVGVMAMAANRVHQYQGVEDACATLLQFESGAIGMVDAYFCTGGAPNRVEINGSRATLVVDGMMGQGPGGTLRVLGDPGVVIESDQRNMYLGEVTAFAQAVLDDRRPPISGEDGLHSQRLVAAAYESARTGALRALRPRSE